VGDNADVTDLVHGDFAVCSFDSHILFRTAINNNS
jgi:hypothetical protein